MILLLFCSFVYNTRKCIHAIALVVGCCTESQSRLIYVQSGSQAW